MRFIKYLIVVVFLSLMGCEDTRTPYEKKAAAEVFLKERFPSSATNIQWLDDNRYQGWATFEMKVVGRNRKFLLAWWYGSHNEIGRSITELREE